MILGYSEAHHIKRLFYEFILETFLHGEWVSQTNVYFRNEKDFYHWLKDVQSKCTGACAKWEYRGHVSEDKKGYSAYEIVEKNYANKGKLLCYNDTTYSYDFIQ